MGVVRAATVGLSLLSVLSGAAHPANKIPCERMVETVKAAQHSAPMSETEREKVNDLLMKGLERCTAEDDVHADQYFSQALKIMGK